MDKASIFQKNRRYSILAWVLALLVLAVAVPLNLIFDRINVNFDMTPNSLYTLTKTTTDYLDELDSRGEVVDVYFLATMEELESDLELLALYRTVLAYDAHDCFNLTAFDPDTNPEILKKLNPDGVFNLTAGDFLFVHGDMVKRLPGSLMYAYQLDDNEKVIGAEFRGCPRCLQRGFDRRPFQRQVNGRQSAVCLLSIRRDREGYPQFGQPLPARRPAPDGNIPQYAV